MDRHFGGAYDRGRPLDGGGAAGRDRHFGAPPPKPDRHFGAPAPDRGGRGDYKRPRDDDGFRRDRRDDRRDDRRGDRRDDRRGDRRDDHRYRDRRDDGPQICRDFKRGRCQYGDDCRYARGRAETLRALVTRALREDTRSPTLQKSRETVLVRPKLGRRTNRSGPPRPRIVR